MIRAKQKKEKILYFERHHILPKCLGGNNLNENLVLLTAKEHFICHRLLVLIHPNNDKLIRALFLMSSKNSKQIERHIPSAKIYDRIRNEWSAISRGKKRTSEIIQKYSGSLNGSFGKSWIKKDDKELLIKRENLNSFLQQGWEKGRIVTDKQRAKNSSSAKNRKPISQEARNKISIKAKGHSKTPEERSKRSQSLKGRIPWNKGIKDYKNLTQEDKFLLKNSHTQPEKP